MKEHSIDIVVPIHNELGNIQDLIDTISEDVVSVFKSTRIIFVDDGSEDGTYKLFRNMHGNESLSIKYIKFSRNFKKDIAVKCGIDASEADYCAVIDGDLQMPPEAILNAYSKIKEGYDIVHVLKSDYHTTIARKIGSDLFSKMINIIAGFRIHLSDYKVFSRAVASELKNRHEKCFFFAGAMERIGFRATAITYQVQVRKQGKSKFTLRNLFRLAVKSIIAISVKPLRFASVVGLLLSLASILYTGWIIAEKLMHRQPIPGFATLAGGIFLLGGIQLFFMGILGEYLGQIYTEIKDTRQYIVEEEIAIEKADS